MKKILAVALGMTANGLSIVRSLGRKRIPALGIDSSIGYPGLFSRYCKPILCPNVFKKEDDFINFLIKLGSRFSDKPVLFITADKYIVSVSRNRDKLSPYFRFILPDEWIIKSFMDKRKSYPLVKEYGLPCPDTYYINNQDELREILPNLKFPCALKPAYSYIWKLKYGGKKLIVVNSEQDIINSFIKLNKEGQKVMVQEIIPGKDDQLYTLLAYFNKEYRPLAIFTKRKLRQYPIHFGVGTLQISQRNELIIKTGIEFLTNINYTGLIGIEFKFDARDKEFKFIEANLRTVNSGDLAVVSGVDLPYIYYQDLIGEKVKNVFNFEEGVKLVNFEFDIVSFFLYRSVKEITFSQWIKSFQGKLKIEFFAWDDLCPFLFVCFSFIIKALRWMIRAVLK